MGTFAKSQKSSCDRNIISSPLSAKYTEIKPVKSTDHPDITYEDLEDAQNSRQRWSLQYLAKCLSIDAIFSISNRNP